jgi:SAM-dependent methyltransferase
VDVKTEATERRPFLTDAVASGHIIRAHRLQARIAAADRTAGVLFSETVPMVSYPYEWTFTMLRDAALLLLRLLRAGLGDGVMCTTGSAFDIQFWGARPVMVGVGAFRPRFGKEPWPGFRSFSRTFLYPLLLTARGGVPFQPVLRNSPEGIAPSTVARSLKPAMLSLDVVPDGRPTLGLRPHLGRAGWRNELVAAIESADVTAARLEELVESLDDGSIGATSAPGHLLKPPAVLEARDRFVVDALPRINPATVLDMSCADGRYARIAADRGASVVALDPNQLRVEGLYRSLRDGRSPTILPLVVEGGDPGPSLPWPEGGRIAFADRVRAQVVLCLEPIPEGGSCRIGALAEIIDVLARFNAPVVMELAQDLVAAFAQHARGRFTVVRHLAVPVPERTARRYLLELVPV